MKKYALLLITFLLPLQACAVELWKEGEHYEVLDRQVTAKPEIREYFSFWCPACLAIEPVAKQLKASLPENVKFEKIHVNFMGAPSVEIQEIATRTMMIARALKQEDKLNSAMFNYIQKQRVRNPSSQDLRSLFILNDVDKAAFDKLEKSFSVNAMFKRNNKYIADYRASIRGVPTFVVNGKYKAILSRNLTPDQMIDLLIWLTKLD